MKTKLQTTLEKIAILAENEATENKASMPQGLQNLLNGKSLVSGIMALNFLLLGGCATVVDQYGQTRQVLTPTGSAIAQALVSTGVGAGAGALMNNNPGWATGMVAGLAGNVASQVVGSMSPRYGDQYVQNPARQMTAVTYQAPTTQMQMAPRAYQPRYQSQYYPNSQRVPQGYAYPQGMQDYIPEDIVYQ